MPSRPVRNALLLAAATVVLALPARAAVVDVQAGGEAMVFTPAVVTIQPGDSVHFTNVGGFHNVRAEDGSFRCSDNCNAGSGGSPSGNPWSVTRTFAQPGTYRYYCEEHGAPGGLGMSGQVIVRAASGSCVPGPNTLCLGTGGRFRAEVAWSSQTSGSGNAVAVPLDAAPQSGLFYFIDPSNIEMLVKVLNACVPALGNHYWVFYAATTNVQFTLTVTDTQTGQVKTYSNALNHAASPVQDTNAFATCP
jgi:plastocyanin